MRERKPAPLFRRVNTKARGVRHHTGGEYRHERNTKQAKLSEAMHQSMGGRVRRGLDYTPLFRFLLSKVGEPWSAVYSEAVARLNQPDPIFWMVALQEHERRDVVLMSESSYYSGLFVDDDGLLQRVNPALDASSLAPSCACCTHTFNGVRFTRRFSG